MDGVLEGAAGLCVCKLACSLFFLPSLAQSNSPFSFCCCCLLVFTDFLLSVFLTCLSIFESWLPDLTPTGDVIALRFLLLLGDTYGVVFILTTPLIAMETLVRYLWHHRVAARTTFSSYGKGITKNWETKEKKQEEEEGEEVRSDSVKTAGWCHGLSYLCCLSVWVIIVFKIRWNWKMEEVWVTSCLHTTGSLVLCLPKLLGPFLCAVSLCLCVGLPFLFLLLLNTALQKLCRAVAAHTGGDRPTETKGVNLRKDRNSTSTAPHNIDSACTCMASHHHGDGFVVFSEGLSGRSEGQEECGRTKEGVAFTSVTDKHVDLQLSSQSGRRRLGFPCPQAKEMIEMMSMFGVLVLPLNLSVNILLIRTVDSLLEQYIEYATQKTPTPPATEEQV